MENSIDNLKHNIVSLIVEDYDKLTWYFNEQRECETYLKDSDIRIVIAVKYKINPITECIIYRGNRELLRFSNMWYPQLTPELYGKIENIAFQNNHININQIESILNALKNEIKDKEYGNGN
jgi:hypothetical protein